MSVEAIAVHFTPTAADVERLEAQRDRLRPPRWYRRAATAFYAIYGVLAVGTILYAVASHIITTLPVRHIPWIPIVSWAVSAAIFGTSDYIASQKAFPSFPTLDPAADVDLRFDRSGIAFGPAGSRVFPWSDVTSIEDVGDAFVIHGAHASSIGVPKHALADGGRELWAFFFDRLVAPRGLIRPTRPQRLILNSTADQRP